MAWDDFLDDLQTKAEEAFSNVSSQAIGQTIDKFLRIGEPPKSNLTAQQVANGERGQAPNIIIQQQSSAFSDKMMKFAPYIIVGIFIILALFIRRKK